MEKRSMWSSRFTFILAAIGSAVGLGNAWRFPGLAAKHGGGTFLVVYLFAMLAMGIPLLMQNAMQSGGRVDIESQEGVGTTITAVFQTDSIDCLPLGDLASTMATIIMGSPDRPEFSLRCASPSGEMDFSTEQIRAALDGVSLAEPAVVQWIQESLQEEIEPILGGIMS